MACEKVAVNEELLGLFIAFQITILRHKLNIRMTFSIFHFQQFKCSIKEMNIIYQHEAPGDHSISCKLSNILLDSKCENVKTYDKYGLF